MTHAQKTGRPRRLALVLWSGTLGGAETFTAALAQTFRAKGVCAQVVFVTDPARLTGRLAAAEVPFEALGLRRGRGIVWHPRKLAQAATRAGADGAILVQGGYLARMLRLGGYRRTIVAVEHGTSLQLPGMSVAPTSGP